MGSGATKRALENSLTALQRIVRLEGRMALFEEDRLKFIEAINGEVGQQQEKTSSLEGVVNAIVEILDKTTASLATSCGGTTIASPGTVVEVLKKHLALRHAAQIARDKAAIAALAEAGSLVVIDTVGEDSLIVGEESSEAHPAPSWVQMDFRNVMEAFQPLLIGKHVGDEVEFGVHKLSIKEIYKILPPVAKAPAATEAAPAPAEEAPETGYVPQTFAEAPAEVSAPSNEVA